MEIDSSLYDVAIIGGGLAGLALSIQLAKSGYQVVLLEKEKYPFHKVCGEYISFESWDFLSSLGLPLSDMDLPKINRLQLSAPNGKICSATLPLGGFGISRYRIDYLLADIARKHGVVLLEEAKGEEIKVEKWTKISFKHEGKLKQIQAKVCTASFGKRSNLDVQWKRPFIQKKDPRINNFVGIKYHVQTDWPQGLIGLHNFKNGYCGISQIEDNKYCLCYLTTADNLKQYKGSIAAMEEAVLFRNPVLKRIFQNSTFLPDFPQTIAQISFSKKSQVENGVLMLGDAAGMITPLCGNGMSMALHSSKIANGVIQAFLANKMSRTEMENWYQQQWQQAFSKRLATGRMLQRFFGSERLSNLFVSTFAAFPFLAKPLIKQTHGRPF